MEDEQAQRALDMMTTAVVLSWHDMPTQDDRQLTLSLFKRSLEEVEQGGELRSQFPTLGGPLDNAWTLLAGLATHMYFAPMRREVHVCVN